MLQPVPPHDPIDVSLPSQSSMPDVPKNTRPKKSIVIFLTLFLLILGMMAVIGIRSTDFRSRAAETDGLEIEHGVLNNGATSVTDPSASNHQFVQF